MSEAATKGNAGIIGLGHWGTALGNHLAANGFSVLGWSHDSSIVESINRARRNSFALPSVELNHNFRATNDIAEATACELVVLALPSSALGTIVPRLQLSATAVLVSAVKGFERDTLLTPTQYAHQILGASARIAVLSGPSFAKDIVAHRPSGVVAASIDTSVSEAVAGAFSSGWMRVYTSGDPIGVEVGGAVKNVIALAAGVCDGMSLGESARAGLITRGLAEMMRLAEAMGGRSQTLAGLSGLGDLTMTATSPSSRNRTVGFRIGQGETLPEILQSLGSVAEGVEAAPLVLKLSERFGVDMPITAHMVELLEGKRTASEMVQLLLSRPIKREFS